MKLVRNYLPEIRVVVDGEKKATMKAKKIK